MPSLRADGHSRSLTGAAVRAARILDAIRSTIHDVIQTTIYLPDDLKRQLEQAARQDRRTEASIVREALAEALRRRDVAPTTPLFTEGWNDPTLAERVDELLAETGFGR